MCATWAALHDSLVRDLNRRASESDFTRLREQYPDFKRFASIPSLIEHQRDLGVDPALGTLHLWRADIPTLRTQIRELRALTDNAFAVNLNL